MNLVINDWHIGKAKTPEVMCENQTEHNIVACIEMKDTTKGVTSKPVDLRRWLDLDRPFLDLGLQCSGQAR